MTLSGSIDTVGDDSAVVSVESDGIPTGTIVLTLYVNEPVETGGTARTVVGRARPEITDSNVVVATINFEENAPDFDEDDLYLVWEGSKAPRGGMVLDPEVV